MGSRCSRLSCYDSKRAILESSSKAMAKTSFGIAPILGLFSGGSPIGSPKDLSES
jgi:hypothetical protein